MKIRVPFLILLVKGGPQPNQKRSIANDRTRDMFTRSRIH